MEHLQSPDWPGAGRIGFASYLLGCFTTGYYLVRFWAGQDIRDIGSGSVGARNVGRALGLPGFMLTLLGDVAKGAFAVWVARRFTHDDRLIALSLVAVAIGHVLPFQLRLRGGKGMATSLGALCVYDLHVALAFACLFAAGFILLRKALVPGLLAFACLPLVTAFLDNDGLGLGYDPVKVTGIWLLTCVVLIAHRKNMIQEAARFLQRHNLRLRNNPPDL